MILSLTPLGNRRTCVAEPQEEEPKIPLERSAAFEGVFVLLRVASEVGKASS